MISSLTVDQALLVKAACATNEECRAAWQQWRSLGSDLPTDKSTARIYPMLYSNLSRNGVQDPLIERLRPLYQASRARNQVLFGVIAEILEQFNASAIPLLLWKGSAMIKSHYADQGARSTSDLDVM